MQFSVTGLLFGSSLFRGKPLADLVNHYATEEMLQAVATEAAKGRLLLIATTDLDSERTVIWDMGAMHGDQNTYTRVEQSWPLLGVLRPGLRCRRERSRAPRFVSLQVCIRRFELRQLVVI